MKFHGAICEPYDPKDMHAHSLLNFTARLTNGVQNRALILHAEILPSRAGAFKISRRQKLSEFYTPRKFSSPQVMSCAAKSHVALLADERVENTVLKFNRVARKLKELIQTAGTAQNGSDLLRANSDLSVTRKF